MTKNPNRKHELVLQRNGDAVQVSTPSGEVFHFAGLDALVLEAADGTNDMNALVALVRREIDPEATRETVFAALDRLADAGLLEGRVAPPAGGNRTTRRDMMRFVGATAAYAVMVPAGAALAQTADIARTGEEHSKNVRAAEEKHKLALRDARAAEKEAKHTWRAAEETLKTERQDVHQADRDVKQAERDVRAAERKVKRDSSSKEAEEYQKKAESNFKLAQRVAEQEKKQYAVAEERAAEAKQKLSQARVSEETAKKTNVSEAARAKHRGTYESEQARKAEQALKAMP